MSPEDSGDEMRPEVDFRGGVRGKNLARYQRWTGLTTATGPIPVTSLSTGEPSAPKLVVCQVSLQAPPRTVVAPKVATAAG
jgi:hypothetical protein